MERSGVVGEGQQAAPVWHIKLGRIWLSRMAKYARGKIGILLSIKKRRRSTTTGLRDRRCQGKRLEMG